MEAGAPTGGGAVGGSGGYSGPIDPNTGLPCSQVFGGCPDGGINVNPGGPVTQWLPYSDVWTPTC